MNSKKLLTLKVLTVLGTLLSAQQVFACVGNGDLAVCVGDKVYKGASYSQGATVVGENQMMGSVTVRSVTSGNLFQEAANGLEVAKGCLDSLCVGNKVFKGASYSQGATVVGINPYTLTVAVQSVTSGNLFDEAVSGLELTQGCIGAVCVGNTVYKAASYTQGAVVVSINPYQNSVSVRSVTSGNLFPEPVAGLDVTQGCIGDVCAGSTIYKAATYTQGALVMGVNAYANTVTVRSVTSGNLFEENAGDVDTTQGCVDGVCVNSRVTRGATYSQGAMVVAVNQSRHTVTVRSVTSGNLFEENTRDLDGAHFPPPPRPQPQPQPPMPPQPPVHGITCVIHSGANAAGQTLFRVMTSTGAIIGTFSTTQDAAAFAQSDQRCYQ